MIKSMAVIGGAQIVNIVLSILRMKVLAMLLGPSGVGLLSIFSNFKEMVAMGAGLGLGGSGVREIASAKGDMEALSRVRRVLFGTLFVQGVLAMAAVWMLRERLAIWLLDDAGYATGVGLIGVAVLLTLLTNSQTALLLGMRHISDLARVTVLGALGGTLVGLLAVWYWGQNGLIWFILAQPLATVLVAHYFTQRLPRPATVSLSLPESWRIWHSIAQLGIVFMLGGLATTATLLLIRSRVTQELGLDAAGHFAAAWSITMIYVGFLLQAMGADFFPRLTEVIDDRAAANRLMNDQSQLALALAGPVLLLMIGGAPWLIRLLYSAELDPAATLLQWQSVGNVFQLASWPLGFAFVAANRAKLALFLGVNFNILFIVALWVGFPLIGLNAAGIGFLFAYIVHFAVLDHLARRLLGFRWQPLSLWLIGGHGLLAVALLALSLVFPVAGAIMAVILATTTGLAGGHIVITKIGPEGRLVSRVARFYTAIRWPIQEAK
jgi:PST family polysaccharide transporter